MLQCFRMYALEHVNKLCFHKFFQTISQMHMREDKAQISQWKQVKN